MVIQLKLWSEARGTGWSLASAAGASPRCGCGIAEGTGTGSLDHHCGSSFPAAGMDEPERWLMLFHQHAIFSFLLLTQACSGHTVEEITGTGDAVSQPTLWFLPEPQNALGWCW